MAIVQRVLIFIKKPKIFIATLVLAMAVLTLIGRNRSQASAGFETYTVKRGDIAESITVSGNADTGSNASVHSATNGIVEAVYVQNGNTVKEGQELVRIKSTATDIDRANALAAYQAAKSTLNTAQSAKTTNQSLLEAGRKAVIDASLAVQAMTDRRNLGSSNPTTGKAYTPDEIESITSAYTSARQSFAALEKKFGDSDAAIAAAQGAATAAWYGYQATVNGIIKAPVAGKILNLSVAPGDEVRAKTATVQTNPVLRISSSDGIGVSVMLSEVDVAKVHTGSPASVTFDAFPDTEFDAAITRIDDVGSVDNAVVTYTCYLAVKTPDPRIRPAMTATVTIRTDPKKGVLLVPNTALYKENDSIKVRVQTGKTVTAKPVTVGVKNTDTSEITSGVKDGEQILIPKNN